MASEIKSDKLSPSTGTALQIGDASDTITIPTGATFTITDGLGVAGGGTGLTGFTAGDVLYATGTTTLAKLAKGTAEQVLAMNTGATAPDWGSVDLTVLPTITVAKGGTNLTSFTAGDILYATGSTTLAKLAKGSADDVLTMNSGATAPEWAAAAGGGKLLQVQQAIYSTGTSSSSNSYADTGLTDAITCSATSSKVLVIVLHNGTGKASSNTHCQTKLFRQIDSGAFTELDFIDGNVGFDGGSGYNFGGSSGMTYLDSPSSTGVLTYKTQFASASNSATVYVQDGSAASSITLMEIGA